MTTDTLDLPPIEAAPMPLSTQPAAFEPGTLKATALASFVAIRDHAAKLAEKYRAVAFDVSTPKGMAAAKDARLELREDGRFAVQRLRDRLKDEANDLKRVVTDEAEAVIKIIAPVEDAIHAQITAEEERKKAEKAEAARVLAERQQKQAEGVASIRAYLSRAQTAADMTAERVGKGIALLEAMTFSADDWLDPVAAANAQCETLEGMRVLQATLQAREEAAAAAEAQRLENERMAAELAAAQAKLQAEQQRIASLKARIAEIQAAATGHEKATAADLYEAMVAVTALDVSEAHYQEFTPLAEAAQDATLAALQSLHLRAVEREEIEAAQRASTLAANVATAAATEGQDDQQVLKAEPATADATDRSVPANTSPCGGTMGAGQPAAAGPAGNEFVLVVPPESTMYAQLSAPAAVEPGVTLISGEVGTIDAGIKIVEPPAMTHAAFLALVMTAFDCKFPSHPKPSAAWWAEVRAAGQQLQGLAA